MSTDGDLFRLGRQLDRRVRRLFIHCGRCGLKVVEVNRPSLNGQPYDPEFTYGGLSVTAAGARWFRIYRPEPATRERTFTWCCAKGHEDSRRIEAFLRAWPIFAAGAAKPKHTIHLIAGRDV